MNTSDGDPCILHCIQFDLFDSVYICYRNRLFFLSVQCFIVLLLGWGLCRSDCRSSFANVHLSPSLFIIIFTLYRFLLLKHRRVYAYDRERYRNTERNRRIERQKDWKTERLKETKTPMEQASEIFMYPSMHSSFNETKRCSTHQQTR